MVLFSTLDKFYEADDVEVASGTPIVPGTAYRDIAIPEGETWELSEIGGSSSIDSTEVEILYSEDNGSTWVNPYDDQTTKIRCLHLSAGQVAKIFLAGVRFVGGANHIIRIKCKNFNETNKAEIAGWLNGVIIV